MNEYIKIIEIINNFGYNVLFINEEYFLLINYTLADYQSFFTHNICGYILTDFFKNNLSKVDNVKQLQLEIQKLLEKKALKYEFSNNYKWVLYKV